MIRKGDAFLVVAAIAFLAFIVNLLAGTVTSLYVAAGLGVVMVVSVWAAMGGTEDLKRGGRKQ